MADKVPVYTPYSIHPIKLAYLECLYRVNVGQKEDRAGVVELPSRSWRCLGM